MASVRSDEEQVMKTVYASKIEEIARSKKIVSRDKLTIIGRIRSTPHPRDISVYSIYTMFLDSLKVV